MTKNAFGAIFSRFMESIHIELTDETINFFMAKVFRENNFLEFIDVFNDKITTGGSPKYNLWVFFILNYGNIYFQNFICLRYKTSNLWLLVAFNLKIRHYLFLLLLSTFILNYNPHAFKIVFKSPFKIYLTPAHNSKHTFPHAF